jgi:uncharacterized membrane protein
VIGDQGITEKVGDRFWKEVVDSVGVHFKNADFTRGVVEAIDLVGRALGEHFPRRGDDRNELSDRVIRG